MDKREYQREYQLARYHRRRLEAIDRLGGQCAICGSIKDLQIDHIDPSSKSFNISKIWGVARQTFDEELQKCQVLCQPCHISKSSREATRDVHGTWGTINNRGCRCDVCREFRNSYMREYKKRTKQ